MQKEGIAITEPFYSRNVNKILNNIQKNTLALPLITSNISNSLSRENSHNKVFKNIINLKRERKKNKNKKILVAAHSLNQKRFKIKKDLELVYKLNMEIDVDQIFNDDFKLKKEREKIDNSPDIKAKRLNIYKNRIEKKNEKKIEVDSKEKERYIEKEFKDKLEKLETVKRECNIINMQINEIRTTIEELKLEINLFNNYGYEIDKKYIKEIMEKEKSKLDIINNEIIEQSNENDENEEKNNNNNNKIGIVSPKKNYKQEKFEQINAFNQMKRKKDERFKYLNETVKIKEEQLKLLEEKQNKLIEECKEKKANIYQIRQQLLNIYHINLYEGLNFRAEGLATIIRSIWNLGVNVDINYMPSYLDNLCIDYLFDRTKRLIKISKMRQIIDENEKEFEASINQWKQTSNIKENSKDSEEKTNSNFFQTGVIEGFNDKYPKSRLFMEDYNKKYIPKNDKIEVNLKHKNEFKSKNIPYTIIEKYNKIEKLKILLNNLIEQNDNKEKKEIQRLCKEFLNNNYEENYQVSPETIIGALCGEEKKNEAINLFTKYQREFKEGKKMIQFHTKINRFAQKK